MKRFFGFIVFYILVSTLFFYPSANATTFESNKPNKLNGSVSQRSNVILSENFSNGLSNWILYGSPSSRIVSSIDGYSNVFDNNGDAWCDSGAISKKIFDISPGTVIEFDIYLKATSNATCWDEIAVGLTKEEPLTGGDCAGENYQYQQLFDFQMDGTDCSADPASKVGHAYIYTDSGKYTLADQYKNSWHHVKITVKQDYSYDVYIDGSYFETSSKPIDSVYRNNVHLLLGKRSSGDEDGKAYIDNVEVTQNKTGQLSFTPWESDKASLEPGWIKHGNGYDFNKISSTFEVLLKVRSDGSNHNIANFCDDYSTKIISPNNTTVAKQIFCHIDPNKNELALAYSVNNDGRTYFDNGSLELCDKDGNNCKDMRLPTLSVYGTKFNIRKDAYSFGDGLWNEAKKFSGLFFNNIAKITNVVASYMDNSICRNTLWNSVGWTNFIHTKEGGGLCYGMALSSAANFNRREDSNTGWGVSTGKFNAEEWEKAIDEHWGGDDVGANPPYRPYSTNDIYNAYGANSYQALEKIIYYHVAQQPFNNCGGSNWIGRDEEKCVPYETQLNKYIEHVLPILKNGEVAPLGVHFKNGGSHDILLTQLIEAGNLIKLVIYDNNYPSTYSILIFRKKANNLFSFNSIEYTIAKKFNIDTICYLTKEPLHSFKTLDNENKRALTRENTSSKPTSINYQFPNHIEVYIVGGTFNYVKTSDGQDVTLYPLSSSALSKNKTYVSEQNVFRNKLFLPADKHYEISIKKDSWFLLLKAFVTVPYENGTVEFLSYDNLTSVSQNGYVTLYVGRNNKTKNIIKTDSISIAPSSDSFYTMKLQPVSSLQAIVENGGVKLVWDNPSGNPNYGGTVIVRKEGGIPQRITDGTEIYRGTQNNFFDDSITPNQAYYYAAFALDKNGNPTEPTWTYVDTHKYTLYGYIKDQSGNSVGGVAVTLYTGTKNRIVQTTTTDSNGLFTFNNLLDGNYILGFEKNTYKFDNNSQIGVMLSDTSKKVDVIAYGTPALFMNVPQTLTEGQSVKIIWSGTHTSSTDKVDIKLLCNNKWFTVASNIPISKGYYVWKVDLPNESKATPQTNYETATLSVELSNNSVVKAEKEVGIIRSTTPAPSSSSSSSGGGGCTADRSSNTVGLLLLLLIPLFYVPRYIKKKN